MTHKFELANLGKAPYKFCGLSEERYQPVAYMPSKPGTSCDYCGEAIVYAYWLKSSDGKKFKVGCNCIEKSGDKGLSKTVKSSAEYRELQLIKRRAKAQAVQSEINAILNNPQARTYLESKTAQFGNYYQYIRFILGNCGDSGKARWLRELKKILKEGQVS